jgi:hypothetical protein
MRAEVAVITTRVQEELAIVIQGILSGNKTFLKSTMWQQHDWPT